MCPEIPSEADIAQAMKLAKSPTGRQLIEMLMHNNEEQVLEAMSRAQGGDFSQISQILGQLLTAPEAEALVKKIRGGESE